jgi:CHAD domain-containing protein
MSYIKKEEIPEEGVKRLLLELMEDTSASLKEFKKPNECIHEARTSFKKMRALLRLVRKETGEAAYKSANVAFRDAGRKLSVVRDSWVLHQTTKALAQRYEELLADNAFATILRRLRNRHTELLEDFRSNHRREEVLEVLENMKEPIRNLPVASTNFQAFYGGLRKVYNRGREAALLAWETGTTEILHDWRKRVKYLYYQLGYLQQIWPKELDAFENSLQQLSDLLGEDHDLAVLVEILNEEDNLTKDPKHGALLKSIITREREAIQQKLWPLAQRLYKEEPEQFAGRISAYWVAMKMEVEGMDKG